MRTDARRCLITIVAALGSIAIAGCGSDGLTAPSASSQPADVSAIVSQMASGSLGAYPGMQSMFGSIPDPQTSVSVVASNCLYSAATQSFVCPQYASAGVTFNVSYWLYDASGHPLSSTDATNIASIRTVVDFKGTVVAASGAQSASVVETGHGDMTMSGLLTDHRTLNGTSTLHGDVAATGPPTAKTTVDLTEVTTNLDVPVETGGATVWPKTGTIGIDVKTSADAATASVSVAVHSVITFNGTNKATVTTSINGVVATTCSIDLATGATSCF